MLCAAFYFCDFRVFIFGFVKVARKLPRFSIYQQGALFLQWGLVIQSWSLCYVVTALQVWRLSGSQCLFSVLIFGASNASAICHLSGVPSVVQGCAYRVYNKWFKPTPTLCRFVHSLRSLSHKAFPVPARFNQALAVLRKMLSSAFVRNIFIGWLYCRFYFSVGSVFLLFCCACFRFWLLACYSPSHINQVSDLRFFPFVLCGNL